MRLGKGFDLRINKGRRGEKLSMRNVFESRQNRRSEKGFWRSRLRRTSRPRVEIINRLDVNA